MEPFYHALKVASTACIGCTHCMSLCPTQAIRIKGGLATINKKCLRRLRQMPQVVSATCDIRGAGRFQSNIQFQTPDHPSPDSSVWTILGRNHGTTNLRGTPSNGVYGSNRGSTSIGHLGKSHTTLYGKEFLRASFHLVLLPGNRPLNTGTFSLADRPHCPVKTSHGPSSHFRP